ncbi:MAG: hypothetical protein HYV96_17030 [Opitutae bacterium]|nr:hypothetical protein [Opitutae bacterium]
MRTASHRPRVEVSHASDSTSALVQGKKPPVPRLSVVTASRNDDHGGDPLVRTQLFINALAFLAEKYCVSVEIVMVDWNPVAGRPGLAGVLQLPAGSSFCTGRVITVPAELHRRFKYSENLAFYQMIAKNAGIRRARGDFVLSTNIDILFSEDLFRLMTTSELRPDRHYRVDRIDIAPGLPVTSSLAEILAHTRTPPIRANRRFAPAPLLELAGSRISAPSEWKSLRLPGHVRCRALDDGLAIEVDRDAPMSDLHTNACGDFALMSREAWHEQRGYPEFEAFSFNIDSIGLLQSHYGGFTEVSLLPPFAAFHLEHSLGSGWTPEGEKKLFQRLDERRILNPDWRFLNSLVEHLRAAPGLTVMNREHWGLAGFDLPEEPLFVGRTFSSPPHPRPRATPWPDLPACALRPEFDLDRWALWEERRERATEERRRRAAEERADAEARRRADAEAAAAEAAARAAEASAAEQAARVRADSEEAARRAGPPRVHVFAGAPHFIQVFWPDTDGNYSERNAITVESPLDGRRKFHFALPPCAPGSELRFDPTSLSGFVEVHSLEIFGATSGDSLWSTRENGAAELRVAGTALILRDAGEDVALRLFVTGNDPQILLPSEAVWRVEPLFLVAELSFFPHLAS